MANVKKKRQVVMLPTKKASVVGLYEDTIKLVFNNPNHIDIPRGNFQHLYILSDEEIKEGDWFINELNQVWQHNGKVEPSIKSKKIISATDTSLKIITGIVGSGTGIQLPQPSPQFIQAYIEAYNAGNPIVDVMVEYEEYAVGSYGLSDGEPSIDERLKVDRNNYITITKCKESWSRDEVKLQLWKFALSLGYNSNDLHSPFDKWIANNL